MKANSIFIVKIKIPKLHSVPAYSNIWNLQFNLLVDENIVAAQKFVIDQEISDGH